MSQDTNGKQSERMKQVWRKAALRVERASSFGVEEELALEEPLEIRLLHGPLHARQERALSVTMRTPGNDDELAAGFLLTEGIVRDSDEIEFVRQVGTSSDVSAVGNVVLVTLAPHVVIAPLRVERNFYMTSSCGICGKASLLSLQTVCPPRRENTFRISAETIRGLPQALRVRQQVFDRTGGLHGAALCSRDGEISSVREDVGRHNAVDKLIGAAALAGELPLREYALLLSGRVSFELVQKAVMAGIPAVIAVGAPSSLAVRVAAEFDVTLIGFLRDDHFNVYHGAERVRT